ncbi:MAG: flippase-like domain-containing protein [Bacteroidales bacterium]|nr:flippase-like domain-containing protein [Bacteroidales bacterium]
MAGKRKNPLSKLRRTNIIYPVIIGLGFVVFMFYRNFDPEIFQNISFSRQGIFWLFFAICLMAMRDLGYMARLKILSDNQYSWLQTFRIVMLWEFTSAITPSAIGGTSVAVIFLNKEGLSLGRSSAIVMATSFLDELYFLMTFPLLLIFIKSSALFSMGVESASFINRFFWLALAGYSIKLVYTLALTYGLFINPRGLKWLLLWVFRLPLIRRWRAEANEAGSEIVNSSIELRKKPFFFWIKAFISTAFAWTSRYWVVNALFLIFFFVPDHLLLYARQLVAWIMMLVIPTPGGSGGAEWVFTEFLGDLIQYNDPATKASFALILAFLWRLISYYPYLVIGTIILPKWIRLKFTQKQED